MRRVSMLILSATIAAAPAGAQRPRIIRVGEPAYWFSAGIGGFSGNGDNAGVNDGRTGSAWNFGNSLNLQYRASLEKSTGNGMSLGIAGTYSRVPFVYSSDFTVPLPNGTSGARCGQCDAHLDMTTIVGLFRAGAGVGFHQVIELSGGIVAYQNLKEDATKTKLAPSGGNIDPIFSLGYGLGYGLSDRTELTFVPDYAIALHERSGLSNGVSNTNSIRSLRVSLRMGFGGTPQRRR
jgi:hypothetical protein